MSGGAFFLSGRSAKAAGMLSVTLLLARTSLFVAPEDATLFRWVPRIRAIFPSTTLVSMKAEVATCFVHRSFEPRSRHWVILSNHYLLFDRRGMAHKEHPESYVRAFTTCEIFQQFPGTAKFMGRANSRSLGREAHRRRPVHPYHRYTEGTLATSGWALKKATGTPCPGQPTISAR